MRIKLSEIMAPSFYNLHVDIKNNRNTEYMLKRWKVPQNHHLQV